MMWPTSFGIGGFVGNREVCFDDDDYLTEDEGEGDITVKAQCSNQVRIRSGSIECESDF